VKHEKELLKFDKCIDHQPTPRRVPTCHVTGSETKHSVPEWIQYSVLTA